MTPTDQGILVGRIAIVTGAAPQEKRITPPARTAETTRADVQLAGLQIGTVTSVKLDQVARVLFIDSRNSF